MQNPSKEQLEKWHNDSKNWKLRLFYFNKEDDRIFVPKKIQWMGITLNFANPKTYLALVFMVCFFGFIVFMIVKNRN